MKNNSCSRTIHGRTAMQIAFVVMLMIFGSSAYAQTPVLKTIKGTVKFSEDNDVAPGVNIYLKGATASGTYSDGKGQFEFPGKLKAGDVLVFSFIGRETFEYVVSDQTGEMLDIVMGPDAIQMVEDVLVVDEATKSPSMIARVIGRGKAKR